MYTQADKDNATKKMWIYLGSNVLILAVCIGIAAVGLKFRLEWLSMIGCAMAACLTYGFFVLKTWPWCQYWKFLKDMFEGRSRKTEGVFVRFAEEGRVSDGVQEHDMYVTVEEGEDPVLFYWDADKPFPAVREGDRIVVTSFGRFVRDLQVAAEA